MRKQFLKLTKRILAVFAGGSVAAAILAVPVLADGGPYLSDSYIEIAEGESATVAVGVDNAVGTYYVSADGNVSASGSGWLENESATISIYGASVGSGTVAVTFDDLATYDDEDLSGSTLYIEVNVYEPDGGYSGGDKGKEKQEDAEPETEEETEEETEKETKEEPKKDSSEEKRTVTINKKTYLVLDDLKDVKKPKGFEEKEVTFNDVPVKVLAYGDELVLYVLQREEDGKILFREYVEETKTFVAPRTIKQNDLKYYLLDAKADEAAATQFTMQTLTVKDFEIKGYVSADPKLSDFCYLRALADGEEGIYAFDQKEGTIQRYLLLSDNAQEEAAQEIAAVKAEAEKSAKAEKTLRILLIVAVVVILGLLGALLWLLFKKKKKVKPTFKDLYPDTGVEEDLPETEEPEFPEMPDELSEPEGEAPESSDEPESPAAPEHAEVKPELPPLEEDFWVTDLNLDNPDTHFPEQ